MPDDAATLRKRLAALNVEGKEIVKQLHKLTPKTEVSTSIDHLDFPAPDGVEGDD